MATNNPYDAPSATDLNAPQITSGRLLQVRRVDIVSCARMLGALYAIGGLIAGVFFSIAALFASGANNAPQALFGIAAAIVLPVVYGFMGLIAGALGALLYNVVAYVVGGIEVELH